MQWSIINAGATNLMRTFLKGGTLTPHFFIIWSHVVHHVFASQLPEQTGLMAVTIREISQARISGG